jgi:hypothetical protein
MMDPQATFARGDDTMDNHMTNMLPGRFHCEENLQIAHQTLVQFYTTQMESERPQGTATSQVASEGAVIASIKMKTGRALWPCPCNL